MLQSTLKGFQYVHSEAIGDGRVLGRHENAVKVTAYENCLNQLFVNHIVSGTSSGSLPSGSIFVHSALPVAKDAGEERRKAILNSFRCLAALSSRYEKMSETPLRPIFQNSIVSNLPVKGLVPRTKRLFIELNTKEDGASYIDIWGYYTWEDFKISMHVGLLDQLATEEVEFKTSRHTSQRPHVINSWTSMDDEHLYRFQIEYKPGGFGDIDAQDEHEGKNRFVAKSDTEIKDHGKKGVFDDIVSPGSSKGKGKEVDRTERGQGGTKTTGNDESSDRDFMINWLSRMRISNKETDGKVAGEIQSLIQRDRDAVGNDEEEEPLH